MIKLQEVFKEYRNEEQDYYFIGKDTLSGKVVEILYHEPSGEGDAHYVDVITDSDTKFRIFRPDSITFWKE